MDWSLFRMEDPSIAGIYMSVLCMYTGPFADDGKIYIKDLFRAMLNEIYNENNTLWRRTLMKAVIFTFMYKVSPEGSFKERVVPLIRPLWVRFLFLVERPLSPTSIINF